MAIETEALPVGLDMTGMTPEDLAALRIAVRSLEHPGLAARLTNMVGKPIELIGDMLPVSAKHAIATATSKGLEAALKVALRTMQRTPHAGSRLLHKALATASGAAGGAFGLATLPIELPVSTIIMLRSIAEIARSEGENLSDPESALSCVQVFALGGRAGLADASESGYFAVRGILAKSVTEAARFLAERSVIEEGAPVLVRFLTLVASPLWRGCHAKGRSAGSSRRRCARWRCRELRVYRTFSGCGPRSFHRSPGSNESTAKTLYALNTNALLRTTEARLSHVRSVSSFTSRRPRNIRYYSDRHQKCCAAKSEYRQLPWRVTQPSDGFSVSSVAPSLGEASPSTGGVVASKIKP